MRPQVCWLLVSWSRFPARCKRPTPIWLLHVVGFDCLRPAALLFQHAGALCMRCLHHLSSAMLSPITSFQLHGGRAHRVQRQPRRDADLHPPLGRAHLAGACRGAVWHTSGASSPFQPCAPSIRAIIGNLLTHELCKSHVRGLTGRFNGGCNSVCGQAGALMRAPPPWHAAILLPQRSPLFALITIGLHGGTVHGVLLHRSWPCGQAPGAAAA